MHKIVRMRIGASISNPSKVQHAYHLHECATYPAYCLPRGVVHVFGNLESDFGGQLVKAAVLDVGAFALGPYRIRLGQSAKGTAVTAGTEALGLVLVPFLRLSRWEIRLLQDGKLLLARRSFRTLPLGHVVLLLGMIGTVG